MLWRLSLFRGAIMSSIEAALWEFLQSMSIFSATQNGASQEGGGESGTSGWRGGTDSTEKAKSSSASEGDGAENDSGADGGGADDSGGGAAGVDGGWGNAKVGVGLNGGSSAALMPMAGAEYVNVPCWYHCREAAMGGTGTGWLGAAEENVLRAGARRTSTLLKVLCMLVEEEEQQAKEEHDDRREQWEQEEDAAEQEGAEESGGRCSPGEDHGEGSDGDEERDSMGEGRVAGNLAGGGGGASSLGTPKIGSVVQCEQLKLKPILHLLAPLHRPTVMGKCYREPLRKLTQLCLQAGLQQQMRAKEERVHEDKMEEIEREKEQRRRERNGEEPEGDDSEDEDEDEVRLPHQSCILALSCILAHLHTCAATHVCILSLTHPPRLLFDSHPPRLLFDSPSRSLYLLRRVYGARCGMGWVCRYPRGISCAS
jgi:hypothetical protein